MKNRIKLKTNEKGTLRERYISPKERQKIIDDPRLIW